MENQSSKYTIIIIINIKFYLPTNNFLGNRKSEQEHIPYISQTGHNYKNEQTYAYQVVIY